MISLVNLAGAVFPEAPKSIKPASYFPLSVVMVALENELDPIKEPSDVPSKYKLGIGTVDLNLLDSGLK